MNQLHQETSPYLLQHANNPVFWKPWSSQILQQAQEQNKLLIISIGYAACHWCHVMEHETFENHEAAAVMNENFISIKIDREERPDIDAIYMKAVQLMTNQGGWPLNVIALPDGRPIWGGTYFRKNDWINALDQLQHLFVTNPEKMHEYASRLHEGVQNANLLPPPPQSDVDLEEILNQLVNKWKRSFDDEFGGNARAPKFMLPDNIEFLLQYGHRFKDQTVLDHVFLSLDKMAMGGIFDTVHGGFSRYSVDLKWHVPHFEKMLYDNGLLLNVYSKAYSLKPNSLYKEIIEKTAQFLFDELQSPEGNFYSSLDADSINSDGKSEEGAYYVWTKNQLEELIGDDFADFSRIYNINEFGHWEHGNYVLIRTKSDNEWAKELQTTSEAIQLKRLAWEKILFENRNHRIKPGLDNKTLTSWNAMAIHGLCEAYKVLENENYKTQAIRAMNWLEKNLQDETGQLLHQPINKNGKIYGFLDDYAFTIRALISIYEITADEKWLLWSRQLLDYCLDFFFEPEEGFFLFNAVKEQELVATHYEMEDNVIPASNSILCDMLRILGLYFENPAYGILSEKMMKSVVTNVDYPSAFSHWLMQAIHHISDKTEVVICGENALDWMKSVQNNYAPNVLFAPTIQDSRLPLFQNRYESGKTLAYVCQNQSCSLPITTKEELIRHLNS